MGEQPRPEAAIGLAELIAAVRDELGKADAARLDRADDGLLELREVELEIQFEVRRGRAARDGLDFRVVSAGHVGRDGDDPAPLVSGAAHRLRVLYGPSFKLVGIDEAGGF